jgi:hypothetical protein
MGIDIISGYIVKALTTFSIITLSYWLPKMKFLRDFVILEVLKLCVQWPKTGNFKELKSKPMMRLSDVNRNKTGADLEKFLKDINENMELAISGVNFEVVLITEIFFKFPLQFHMRKIDNVVISKMGFEVLIIEFEKGDEESGRSLFVEITAYRSLWFNVSIGLSVAIFLGSTLLVWLGHEML